MKIAQVVSTYPPYRGGMGNIAREYAERLRARGFDVHVFTPRHNPVADDLDYVHRVPSPLHFGNAGVVPSLFRRLSGFDVVHVHYPFFGGAEPTIVGKALRKDQALVMTYHMDTFARGWKGAAFGLHRRAILPWILKRADRVLVSSKEYAETCALKDIPGALEKTAILPFGVDLSKFHPGEEPELRATLGIPEGIPVLLFVGGLDEAHYFKGLSVLLEALDNVRGKWHAMIVGEGALRASFEATVAGKQYADRMHFVGGVDDAELPRYYRASAIHAFPSTERNEAFGLVALEAAASGIPTIASDLPGVRSVVLHEETGLLVPPRDVFALRDALELLLVHVEMRERLGLAARKRAELEFAWEPIMMKLENMYRDLGR